MNTTVNLPTECTDPSTAQIETETSVTVSQCATSCQNDYLRNQTSQVVTSLNTLQIYLEILDAIKAAVNCRFVYDAFQSGRTTICTTFMYVLFTRIILPFSF